MSTAGRLIVIVLFDGVDLLDVTGPPEVFSLAARETDEAAATRCVLAAETMDPVTTGAGVRVLPDITFDELSARSIDTLIVPGAVEVDERSPRAPAHRPRRGGAGEAARRPARRVTSVCVGAHILAAAGLLDGKRATTHWSTAQQLAADHPAVEVDADPIFIREGDVWTGAGISACLDLSLALIADDLGESRRAARRPAARDVPEAAERAEPVQRAPGAGVHDAAHRGPAPPHHCATSASRSPSRTSPPTPTSATGSSPGSSRPNSA